MFQYVEFTLEGLIFILFNFFKFYYTVSGLTGISCVHNTKGMSDSDLLFDNNIQWAHWVEYIRYCMSDLLVYLYYKFHIHKVLWMFISTHFWDSSKRNVFRYIWMHYHIYMHLGLRGGFIRLIPISHKLLFSISMTKSNIMWIIFYGLDPYLFYIFMDVEDLFWIQFQIRVSFLYFLFHQNCIF